MNTSFKKIISGVAAVAILAMNVAHAAPSVIGTGSVTGSGAFDESITWDGAFPGSASGSVDGIQITATVAPILTMAISAASLSLGTLSATTATASLNIEVGTNANNGVIITAQSTNGGLKSSTASGVINSDSTDNVVESYKFVSTLGTTDSGVPTGFVAGGTLNSEITNNTAQIIYSTNKPEPIDGSNDVTFNVTASVTTLTPAASDYSDTLTFTVTGSF